MKITSLSFLAAAVLFTASVSLGAPRSQQPPPAAKPPVTVVASTQDKAGCTRMIVRVPGRKTPKTVACAPEVCAKIPACSSGCRLADHHRT